MHVCYLLPPIEFYSPQAGGAVATMAMQQGRRLQSLGHRVSVIAPHENYSSYEVGEYYPLKGITRNSLTKLQRGISSKVRRPICKFDWLYYEYYRAAAQKALAQIKPDVVLCFNDWQTPIFVKKALPNARVFLRLSNECQTKLEDISKSVESVERIFAVSNYILDWTSNHFEIPKEKFVTLPNGADLESFFPSSDCFERISNSQNPVSCIFISRCNPNKGPDVAADAVVKAREENANVELIMAGGVWFYGNERDNKDPFVSEVRRKATLAKADFLGHVARDKVPKLIRKHDVLLLPIRWNEPMPQVAFEAMASGCVVISSPLGGMYEACENAALWAKRADVSEFAAHLIKLDADREMLVEYKKRSIARAAEMTWEKNTGIFLSVLEGRVP